MLRGLRDVELAVGYLRHELATMGPPSAARVMAELSAGAESGDAESGDVLLFACVALAHESLLEVRRSTASALDELGEHDAARMLAPPPHVIEGDAAPTAAPDAGRALTLGERKSLARRRDRQLLARALRDPHRDVIRVLLSNPALTEPDVVRLCARRPVAAEVLREVFRSPRWIVRYGVRLALARNPWAPLDVSLAVVPRLHAHDARDLAASPELPEPLRTAATRASATRTLH